jgi:capsid assembly protease
MTPFPDPSLACAPWAMSSDQVSQVLTKLRNPKALEAARAGKADRGQRLGIRDGVGVLYVAGPLFKRETLLTRISGWTTYELLRRDLQAALDDPKIRSIALLVDSPGGEVSGCDELAAAIYNTRGKKPITAFVSGMACSGGYWIAAAAERVVVSDAAILGSIGVCIESEDRSAADDRRGVRRLEFASSQTPGKRGSPSRAQKLVDDLAAVFIRAVAKYRGVSVETVTSKFGAGGVEIGKNAVRLGMADAVGSFEGVLAFLRSQHSAAVKINITPPPAAKPGPTRATAPAATPVLSQSELARIDAEAKASAKEQQRIRRIFNSPEGRAREDLASHYAFDTKLSADEAIAAIRQETIAALWKRAIENANPIGDTP